MIQAFKIVTTVFLALEILTYVIVVLRKHEDDSNSTRAVAGVLTGGSIMAIASIWM